MWTLGNWKSIWPVGIPHCKMQQTIMTQPKKHNFKDIWYIISLQDTTTKHWKRGWLAKKSPTRPNKTFATRIHLYNSTMLPLWVHLRLLAALRLQNWLRQLPNSPSPVPSNWSAYTVHLPFITDRWVKIEPTPWRSRRCRKKPTVRSQGLRPLNYAARSS